MWWEGTGVGDPFIYWILRFLLLGILFYAGYGISYDKPAKFKTYAWRAGVSYSLVEGLRWMRGADYYHYYNDLVTLFGKFTGLYGRGTITTDPELLYDWWVTGFYYSRLPFWVAFITYSAVLIWAVLLILKHFPKVAVWTLPLFYIITVNQTENLIRQFLAAAFLLFTFFFYLEGEKRKMWTMLVCIPFIHFSGIIAEFIFVFLIYSQEKLGKLYDSRFLLWVLVAVFVFTYFFWDNTYFEKFADFISQYIYLGEDDKGVGYIENADRWFTDKGSISVIANGKAVNAIGAIHNTIQFLSYGAIVWLGFLVKKLDKRLVGVYFFSYLAILMKNIGGDIEMYNRLYNWFYLLMPLMLGCIITNSSLKPEIRYGVMAVILLNFMWYGFLGSILGTSWFGYGFIWDADVNIWWR